MNVTSLSSTSSSSSAGGQNPARAIGVINAGASSGLVSCESLARGGAQPGAGLAPLERDLSGQGSLGAITQALHMLTQMLAQMMQLMMSMMQRMGGTPMESAGQGAGAIAGDLSGGSANGSEAAPSTLPETSQSGTSGIGYSTPPMSNGCQAANNKTDATDSIAAPTTPCSPYTKEVKEGGIGDTLKGTLDGILKSVSDAVQGTLESEIGKFTTRITKQAIKSTKKLFTAKFAKRATKSVLSFVKNLFKRGGIKKK